MPNSTTSYKCSVTTEYLKNKMQVGYSYKVLIISDSEVMLSVIAVTEMFGSNCFVCYRRLCCLSMMAVYGGALLVAHVPLNGYGLKLPPADDQLLAKHLDTVHATQIGCWGQQYNMIPTTWV